MEEAARVILDYTPQTLRYDRNGVDWIVRHARELQEGRWPGGLHPDYLDTPIRSGISSRAPFENPCLVIAELEIRVKRCGLDGFLVEEKIKGKGEEEIARERCMDINHIRRRINKVLWYCASGRYARWFDRCGKCKQPLSHPNWCKQCSPRLKAGEILKIKRGQSYEGWKQGWNWRGK